MIKNTICLESDRITIGNVTDHEFEEIEMCAAYARCTVQVVADDGTYYTVQVAGKERNLYGFMHLVFCGLCGLVNATCETREGESK